VSASQSRHSRGKNILGGPLAVCSEDPLTGFVRSGCCEAVQGDLGMHVVCVQVTKEFLEFSQSVGNDLSTPVPEFGFPGLKPGDRWCLCASRWQEAFEAGMAPPVVLAATHMSALEFVSLEDLQAHAIDAPAE
jgi:uncharacterized protein (DUF2237 family)